MGKEKIEEKDVRLLRYAVEQAFDGAMRDGALTLLNRLVDSASEAANLEEELLNLKGEYQRSMENSKRGAFKRLHAAYKRKCRREKRMAKGQMLCADGKPVMFGETLYGGDGRDWLIVGIAGEWSYDVYGLHASAVNGIYPEDVADLPTIETAIPRLREIFAGADEIIGYNVGFDLGFLSAVGVRPREDARITDTMNEFTWFMGRRYKLVDAADHIGYEWTGRAHGSLADALATLAVQRWLEQWLVAE